MRVFACHNIFDDPVTGGEIFYAQVLDYLRGREDIELILPTEGDLRFLNRPKNCLGVNRYFLWRFQQLPEATIVIESEFFYYNFFLTNCLIKLLRPDLRVMVQVCQVPDILFSDSKTKWMRLLMMFAFLRSADGIGVLSSSLKEQMVHLGARRERTHVVYISAQKLEGLELSNDKKEKYPPRVICVAHIRARKGQKVLIEALYELRDIPFEAVLIGATKDERYEREVRMLVNKYGLENRVRFAGLLRGKDLTRAYAEADIFVLPSYHEPYGIVIHEAMSFGLPVVASNLDGIPEQVSDGVEGFLVPAGKPTALAESLRRLICDPELRAGMGAAGRKRAAALPSWKDVCERFYQTLVCLKEKRLT